LANVAAEEKRGRERGTEDEEGMVVDRETGPVRGGVIDEALGRRTED
jgi:hypothetical protein